MSCGVGETDLLWVNNLLKLQHVYVCVCVCVVKSQRVESVTFHYELHAQSS